MRADRLVALLLMLQRRGRVTASEVAAELEVSERTARRDLEALSIAGIPVYSQPGRGGGWSLVVSGTGSSPGRGSAEASSSWESIALGSSQIRSGVGRCASLPRCLCEGGQGP